MAKRNVLSIDIPNELLRQIAKVGREVRIPNRTEVMRQAMRLGLPLLVQSLSTKVPRQS